jgi:hypothetical protein
MFYGTISLFLFFLKFENYIKGIFIDIIFIGVIFVNIYYYGK